MALFANTTIDYQHPYQGSKKNDGPNVPFGKGDTPINDVLQLLKANRYPIPAMIEYEYDGAGTPVKKCGRATNT